MPPSSSTCVKCDPALAFYVAALTGRWVGGRVGYPGCCPGLGVAGLSARCLHVRPEEATAISPGTMFVQMRAESSSLELCRMQPNFASLMQRTGALAEGRHPGEACPRVLCASCKGNYIPLGVLFSCPFRAPGVWAAFWSQGDTLG